MDQRPTEASGREALPAPLGDTVHSLLGVAESLPDHARASSPAVQPGTSNFGTAHNPALQDHTREFDELVAPLEHRVGQRLNEPARSRCLLAFTGSPAGFRLAAAAALERGDANPIGLLIRMIKDGDHERLEPRPRRWTLNVHFDDVDEVLIERHDSRGACEQRLLELAQTRPVFEHEITGPPDLSVYTRA